MANSPGYRVTLRNSMLDQVNTQLGASPVFLIYAGSQPASVGAAVATNNTIVASLAMAATAFAAATAGSITAATIANDTNAAGGSANWFSLVQSNATTRICDGEVGTSGSDLNLNSQTITTGATVSITSFTITISAD